MSKKGIFSIAAILATVVVLTIVVVRHNQSALLANTPINQAASQATTTSITLFFGEGCPHCATVRQYLNDHNVAAAVPFVEKEVYSNTANAQELTQRANACGLSSSEVGVPFLWDGSKCFVGDQPIMSFFNTKIAQ